MADILILGWGTKELMLGAVWTNRVCALVQFALGCCGDRLFLWGDFYILENILLYSLVVRHLRVTFLIFLPGGISLVGN